MIEVFAEGRVAADAKVFDYGSGRNAKTLVSYGLICDRFYGDENPTYIQCTHFGFDEKLAQHITRGRHMVVKGTLNRNEEGYYSLVVEKFTFGALPAGRANQAQNDLQEEPQQSGDGGYYVPLDDGDMDFN